LVGMQFSKLWIFEDTPYSGVFSWWNLKSAGQGGVGSVTLLSRTCSVSTVLEICLAQSCRTLTGPSELLGTGTSTVPVRGMAD
jgi:hypothetical protein